MRQSGADATAWDRLAQGLSSRMPDPRRAMLVAVGGLCLLSALPLAATGVNHSYLLMLALIAGAGLLVISVAPPEDRPIAMALFMWALLLRFLAVAGFLLLAIREGGPFLGPDSSRYWAGSSDLALRGYGLQDHPVWHFGSWDLAHYYLFAAGIRFLGADLFGLQVLNAGLSALTVPLIFGIARAAVRSAAVPVTALVAFGPSLIALGAVDLLKDPSVLCATLALIWIVVSLSQETRSRRIAGYLLVGSAVAIYLRTSRFYAFAYLEFALIAALVYAAIAGGMTPFRRRAALAAACAIFVAGELIPARARWPVSPIMIAANVNATLASPLMRYYARGLVDRVASSDSGPPGADESGPHEPRIAGPSIVLAMLRVPANFFRRIYGPFIWILPSSLDFKSFQSGEYFLYPGMLLWYALVPPVLTGLVVTAVAMIRRRERRFVLVMLWFFSAVYFAQYLAINLSYRQRDVMLPVLLVFAYVGVRWALDQRYWRAIYLGYWALLAVMAATHLALRAWLVS